MKVLGDEPGAKPLDFVGAGFQGLAGQSLGNDRRILWVHRDGLKRRFARFDDLHAAGNRAASSDTGHQNIHLAVGVGPNFLGGCLFVNCHVGRIFELLRNPRVWRFPGQLFGLGNRAFHAFRAGCQNQFRAQHRQKRAALHRHRFGHRENELVTLCGCDEREGDAGVAAGRLDDHGVFFEDAALFGVFDHGHADAVLDAAERIEKLTFEEDCGVQPGGDLVQFDQRRAPDGFDDVVVDVSHINLFKTRLIDFVSQDCEDFGSRARGILSVKTWQNASSEAVVNF